MTPQTTVTPKTPKPKSSANLTVGEVLKVRRLARRLSLKQVELATRIRGKYLIALEKGDYDSLPHDIYGRGFVQSYADYLELDGQAIAKQYVAERGKREQRHQRRASRMPRLRLVLTPRLLTTLGGAAAAVAIGIYLIIQFSALTAPPHLIVANPARDQVLYGSLITINGHVDDGANVFVNASPILVDGNGNFTDAIALQDGVNTVHVSATNALGKTSTVTRNILAHVPSTDPAAALPTAPFAGVAVAVQVQGSATTVTVRIDGKPAFQGTMLPGTTQTFKGSNTVVISTSNAGTTHITVTNSTTASHDLGSLGNSNQPKDNFEFAADTQFQ